MWLKFRNLFKTNPSTNKISSDPKKIMGLVVEEIESSIQRNSLNLNKTLGNQKDIALKLENYREESKTLNFEIGKALKSKKEEIANNLNQQKIIIDQQVEQYSFLYKNISQTVFQLQRQIEQLKLQKEELVLKEVILLAKLESATSQKDLQKYLTELDTENHIQLFEEEVLQVELENKLLNDFISLDNEFVEIQSKDDIYQQKKEIELAEKKISDQKIKKIDQIFAQNYKQEQDVLKQKKEKISKDKSQLLKELMNQDTKKKEKNNSMEDFFLKEPKADSKMKPAIEDFFKDDKKQKNIDDFFNN